ncbi:hypothetical protein DZ860_14770 [Vibrio sinensis]|uniref:Uncharacterized protein n=1 Tax=Vibrio sinensis TaxID=2302434 RepID=A0A3A6R1G6_9VIBR|nr:hypothetical protein [Vibrio sinensis]RJX69738.1 hypothetical protein DZ860_14770 [Vibrio sinensis]
MPRMYCDCCSKGTEHKVIMKRCEQEHESVIHAFVSFVSTVFQGAHYVKMERQYFCRGCNNQNEHTTTPYSDAKAA